jgi:hypothetical protein
LQIGIGPRRPSSLQICITRDKVLIRIHVVVDYTYILPTI